MELQLEILLNGALKMVAQDITTTGDIDFLLKNIKSDFIVEQLAKKIVEHKHQFQQVFF